MLQGAMAAGAYEVAPILLALLQHKLHIGEDPGKELLSEFTTRHDRLGE